MDVLAVLRVALLLGEECLLRNCSLPTGIHLLFFLKCFRLLNVT